MMPGRVRVRVRVRAGVQGIRGTWVGAAEDIRGLPSSERQEERW